MIRRLLPVKDVPFQRCYCFSAYASLSDTEIISAIRNRTLPLHALENVLQPNYTRAIKLRREMLREKLASHTHQNSTRSLDEPSEHDCVLDGDTDPFKNIPFEQFEWSQVIGRNCENIVGYVTVPIGVAGPVTINGVKYMIPMATTEGALVASTSRGTKAISASGGCTVRIVSDAMTRAPVVLLPTMDRACELISWCDVNLKKLQEEFRKTTTIGKLTGIRCVLIGRRVHLRMKAFTGDAMGMNMLTKGTQHLLEYISHSFPDMKVLSVSGNYCTDKKPSAVNWVEGRGKTVGAEAIVRREIVVNVLKSTPEDVCNLHRDKNLVGSALAGSIGGFNAHAANVVAAIFLATGQDPAQVVEGSHCLTHYEVTREGDLYAALTMPALEVGTTGGGTDLRVQRAALDLIGCGGPHIQKPGTNANILATLIAGSVLCAELSIMCAQAAGHLVEAHLRLNRAKKV